MTRVRWRAVARVEKTHGRRGEVITVPVHGLPFLLREGLGLAVVPPPLRAPRRVVVTACGTGGSGRMVSFAHVDSIADAAPLVGTTLLACTDDLPAGWELLDADLPLGMLVRDTRLGELGRVVATQPAGGTRVWVVSGERGETLVPAVDELIVALDLASKVVTCRLPRGLAPWDGGEHAS